MIGDTVRVTPKPGRPDVPAATAFCIGQVLSYTSAGYARVDLPGVPNIIGTVSLGTVWLLHPETLESMAPAATR